MNSQEKPLKCFIFGDKKCRWKKFFNLTKVRIKSKNKKVSNKKVEKSETSKKFYLSRTILNRNLHRPSTCGLLIFTPLSYTVESTKMVYRSSKKTRLKWFSMNWLNPLSIGARALNHLFNGRFFIGGGKKNLHLVDHSPGTFAYCVSLLTNSYENYFSASYNYWNCREQK